MTEDNRIETRDRTEVREEGAGMMIELTAGTIVQMIVDIWTGAGPGRAEIQAGGKAVQEGMIDMRGKASVNVR